MIYTVQVGAVGVLIGCGKVGGGGGRGGGLSFVLNGIAGSSQHGLCDVFKNWDVSLFLEQSFVFWELLFCNFSWWRVVEDTVFRNL